MKQIKFLGILAIALSLGLAACNNNAGDGQGSEQQAGEQSQQAGDVSECERHQWDTKVTIKEPTCTEPGQSQRTCKVCGAKEDPKEIKALGHDYQDVTEGFVDATCTEPGHKNQKCSRCNDIKQGVEIPAKGHDFQDLGEEAAGYVAPGYGTPGVMPQKCSRCPETKTREIPALERGFAIDNASLVKKEDNKVYLRLAGTCDHYTVETFKWAFALRDYNSDEGDENAYLAGKEEPEAADFNIEVALTAGAEGADDTFTVDFNLTDIEVPTGRTKPGRYNLMAGPADNYKSLNVDLNPGNYADNAHRYYFRNDNEVGSRLTVCIEELPPYFHFTNAVASLKDGATAEDPKVAWVRIYGEALDQTQSKADLEAALAAANTACRFQAQSNAMTQRNDADVFYFDVTEEGGKLIVSIWINIQFMVDGSDTVYNTHLNLRAHNPISSSRDYTNCVMEGEFDNVLDLGEGRTLTVFSHPLGANYVENSYGNLGFRTATA